MRGKELLGLAILIGVCFHISILIAGEAVSSQYWGQWRGPESTGVSRTADPPIEWSETTNIQWKLEIPGRGFGSPVVWGDHVFLTTAIPVNVDVEGSHEARGTVTPRGVHRFVVMAIARSSGEVVWERTVREEEPHEAAHADYGTWASNSVVTDGEHVFAYFESRGLFAFDMDGVLLWEKDLGDKAMRNKFGEGSTPALYGDRLVIVWDHLGGQSFVVTLNKYTGDEIWRVDRDEIDTWATPLVVDEDGDVQVIVSGTKRLKSYDFDDGSVVWECDGLTMNPIPSPVYAEGLVFAMSGYRGNNLKAIQLSMAQGDITGTNAIAWELNRDTPYVPSPLLYDGILYFLKTNSGVLSAFDAKTGEPHYRLQRLPDVLNVFSSPVGASGRVYIAGRDGTVLVIRHGTTFEVLAKNIMDDQFDASPALVGNEIYLRGHRYLYRIGS